MTTNLPTETRRELATRSPPTWESRRMKPVELDEDGTTADVTEGDNGDTPAEDDSAPVMWWKAKVNYINQQAHRRDGVQRAVCRQLLQCGDRSQPELSGERYDLPGGTVTDTAPTYAFLSSELNAGEDVEIAFQAYDPTAMNADGTKGAWIDHALALTGISMTDNMDDGNYDEVGDTGTITYIDPNNPANPITGPLAVDTMMGGTRTPIVVGAPVVGAAVSIFLFRCYEQLEQAASC